MGFGDTDLLQVDLLVVDSVFEAGDDVVSEILAVGGVAAGEGVAFVLVDQGDRELVQVFLGSSIPPMYSAASADIKRVTTINGVNQNRGVCMTVRADGSVFLLIVSRPAFVRAEFLGLSVNAKVRRGSLSICPRRWRPVRSATGRIAGSLIRKG